MESDLIKTLKEGQIITISLNREHVLNAINSDMLNILEATLAEIEKDNDIRVCLLTGTGNRAFSAGGDMKEEERNSPVEEFQMCKIGERVCNRLETLSKPVIAVINGYALGGGLEIALACDFRVSSSTAKFGLPEINYAVTSGWGGSSRLMKIVGLSKAKEIAFFGEMFKAKEALAIGLIDKLVHPQKLLHEAKKMATILADKPPFALGLLKLMMNQNNFNNLSSGVLIEMISTSLCYSTEDKKKAFDGFFNKYKPDFEGK